MKVPQTPRIWMCEGMEGRQILCEVAYIGGACDYVMIWRNS